MRAAPPTTRRRGPDWRDASACRDINDDTFFPQPGDTRGTEKAKAICAGCPVRRTCLETALAEEGGRTKDNRFGVRGGLTHNQRYTEYTRRRLSAVKAAA
ncbi:WhiB family transcriptional regulator [Streptomyces europaeiscabiei]|uniref:WhiB family transcriptional regulator n=1 Tax=Streptomyces europaeiscabiei TaxID=146819 RepID=UPI0029A6F009|nr:WhiB family transcriptional regulator [Streptomyces europaeiscabiei]MDX3587317.1 WhiB family transcriptional regulator [Streptomyces europaeiscabiei]